ncbi:MAG TPA: hypothetical protein VNU49_08455 [Opitutaceae bacterium]|jgi:hypothetical protein|nr:hypothetical protein [Opitutaceae bacterium]
MPKVQFIGRVFPDASKVSATAPDLNWKQEDIGLDATFRIKISDSVVNINCDITKFESDTFVHLFMRVLDLSRALVNMVAFTSGYGLTVVLDAFIDPNGTSSLIAMIDPSLPPLCTSFSMDPARQKDFGTLCQIVLTEPQVFFALNELIGAISVPHVSLINCARAMDGLKHLLASPGSNESQAWKQMRDALRLDEGYLKFITHHSKGSRHAEPGHTPGTITTEVTRRAWTIMNRYFELRKRGQTALPATEFPLLTG